MAKRKHVDLMPEFSRRQLSENFWADEFHCPCPRCEGLVVNMDEIFIVLLQNARDYYKRPMIVTAGWRCREYQLQLNPEVPNSAHTRGMAADIRCISSTENFVLTGALRQAGFNRLGRYFHVVEGKPRWTHIHVDSDPALSSGVEWIGKAR